MKIISNFHDYYDVVHWHDSDDSVKYLRKTRREKGKELLASFNECWRRAKWDSRGDNVNIETRVLVFCGKAYPFIVYREQIYWTWESYLQALKDRLEEVKQYGAGHLNDKRWVLRVIPMEIAQMTKNRSSWHHYPTTNNRKETWERLKSNLVDVDWNAFHLTYQSPVLLLEDWDNRPGWRGVKNLKEFEQQTRELEDFQGHLIVNPLLRPYNFASVVDPATAYQELDMFIGNTLTVRESADRVRSSEEVRDAHGFGTESFVGLPGLSKKERRRLNKQRKKEKKDV